MGCRSYEAHGATIRFSEVDDDVGCLCTFAPGDRMDASTVRSLAMLGAAVIMAWDEAAAVDWQQRDAWIHLPGSLPAGFLEAIDRFLPRDGE